MIDTARALVESSLRLIGVLASGEAASAAEATDGLNSLNDMLDSWSNENLFIPNKVREVFPLTSAKQTYTMGASGDFNTTRPISIENVLVQLGSSSPAVEMPMRILTKDEFANITLKGTTSTFPEACYPEGTYPLETLNVWPVPTTGNNLVIYSAKPLANLSGLSSTISLPPGYQRMIRFNLAVELGPEYGKAIPEAVAAIAETAKAAIKRKNSKPKYLLVDEAISARASIFDWRLGESR